MIEVSDVYIVIPGAFIVNIITLLTVINPPLQIPTSGNLLKEMKDKTIGNCIFTAMAWAFGILCFFACFGISFLKYIGISVNSFAVAGGALLFIIGVLMMIGKPLAEEGNAKKEICVVPIAIPFIAGPGAITITTLMSQNDPVTVWLFPLVTIFSILACLCVTGFILFYSDKLTKLFGEEGNKAVARIMGVVIAAIGVENVVRGMLELIGI